jgi:hypothetical protein
MVWLRSREHTGSETPDATDRYSSSNRLPHFSRTDRATDRSNGVSSGEAFFPHYILAVASRAATIYRAVPPPGGKSRLTAHRFRLRIRRPLFSPPTNR